jgi:hypothetical protein
MEREPLMATLDPSPGATRLLVMDGRDELLRAVLGPAMTTHPRAAATLLEGLALWHQRPLAVALCVDERESSSSLHLYDALGVGDDTVHYRVAVVARERRARGRRIPGVGCFGDLRQLCFEGAFR